METIKKESQGKYIFVIVPGHPMSDLRGRVLEHRYVMSQHLGRILSKNEVVHHKEGNTKNNNINNLKLMDRDDHNKHHRRKTMLEIICPQCGNVFLRDRRKYNGIQAFCSRSCSSKFNFKYSGQKRASRVKEHGYGMYRKGCRCEICRMSNTIKHKKYRDKKRGMAQR